MSKIILEAQGLCKSFKEEGMQTVDVLKNVSLTIQRAEFVAIVGSSGSGKSTLLHILGGLDVPTQGKVTVLGQNLSGLNEVKRGELRNRHLGFVYQFHHLLSEFTALENVCMPLLLRQEADNATKERAEELLVMLGLKDRINNLPSQMSGGEQQRTAVDRALMNAPAIIFDDEPSGNLDSKNAQELHELFFTLRDKFQQTFVIVTHNEELANMADRKLIMQDGLILK